MRIYKIIFYLSFLLFPFMGITQLSIKTDSIMYSHLTRSKEISSYKKVQELRLKNGMWKRLDSLKFKEVYIIESIVYSENEIDSLDTEYHTTETYFSPLDTLIYNDFQFEEDYSNNQYQYPTKEFELIKNNPKFIQYYSQYCGLISKPLVRKSRRRKLYKQYIIHTYFSETGDIKIQFIYPKKINLFILKRKKRSNWKPYF